MIGKYGYVLRLQGNDPDPIFTSCKKIPAHELMFLIMDSGAYCCETYETFESDNVDSWNLISINGGIETDGIFNSL